MAGFRDELNPMIRLAGPLILAELGWMTMGIVDTIMVGPLGPSAIGAVGVAGILFFTIVIFGMGMMLGLDALVSHAFGAGRVDECHRWLVQAVYLAVAVALPLHFVVWIVIAALPLWGFSAEVLALIPTYLSILCSTDCRLSPRASFEALATPARRSCGMSPATG